MSLHQGNTTKITLSVAGKSPENTQHNEMTNCLLFVSPKCKTVKSLDFC